MKLGRPVPVSFRDQEIVLLSLGAHQAGYVEAALWAKDISDNAYKFWSENKCIFVEFGLSCIRALSLPELSLKEA